MVRLLIAVLLALVVCSGVMLVTTGCGDNGAKITSPSTGGDDPGGGGTDPGGGGTDPGDPGGGGTDPGGGGTDPGGGGTDPGGGGTNPPSLPDPGIDPIIGKTYSISTHGVIKHADGSLSKAFTLAGTLQVLKPLDAKKRLFEIKLKVGIKPLTPPQLLPLGAMQFASFDISDVMDENVVASITKVNQGNYVVKINPGNAYPNQAFDEYLTGFAITDCKDVADRMLAIAGGEIKIHFDTPGASGTLDLALFDTALHPLATYQATFAPGS